MIEPVVMLDKWFVDMVTNYDILINQNKDPFSIICQRNKLLRIHSVANSVALIFNNGMIHKINIRNGDANISVPFGTEY